MKPNDPYMGRIAPLTSKCCILYIYSTNIGTEYFKHALYSPFFFSSKCSLFHNANLFGYCIIHILYTGCAKIKINNSGVKGLIFGGAVNLLSHMPSLDVARLNFPLSFSISALKREMTFIAWRVYNKPRNNVH